MNIYDYKYLYPDRTQPDWVRVLPLPGRPLQSAELLEMQSIWMAQLKNSMGALYRSGSPLSGLRIINTSIISTPDYHVTPGVILVDGLALPVAGKALGNLDLTKTHHIYVQVNEQIVTELDDPSLRDPAHGGALYGLEGAHRLLWSAGVVLNPSPALGFKLGEIQEGRVIQSPLTPGYQSLIDLMAQYTYERSGNFLVRGLSVSYSHNIPGVDSSSPIGQEVREAIDLISIDISNKKQEMADLNVELTPLLNTGSNREAQVKQLIENLATVITILEEDLKTLTTQLASYPSPKPSQEVFLISPGVAYVLGYRVNRPYPEVLSIPRQSYKREAISARYVYSPITQSITTLVTGTSQLLECVLDGLRGIPLVTIRVLTNTSQPSDILLDYLIAAFREGHPLVTFIAEGYSSDAIRLIIASQVAIERLSDYSIKFTLIYSRDLVSLSIGGPGLTQVAGLFISPSNLLPIKKYELAVKPVAFITRVVADLLVDAIPITRGPLDDYLGDDTVLQIHRVEQGRTIFIEGQDYLLVNNSVQWLQGGPEIGTTYYVSFSYTQPLNPQDDYRLVGDSIEFIGRTPMYGGIFTVDYEYYLAQICLTYIDKEGVLGYLISPPSPTPTIPVVTDDLLPLALIRLSGVKPVIEPFTYQRITPQILNELMGLAHSLLQNTDTFSLTNINQSTSRFTLIGRPAQGLTVEVHTKTIALRYLGGGDLHGRDRVANVLSLPQSSSEPSSSLLPDGADQPRMTGYITLRGVGQPYLQVSPRVNFKVDYVNPIPYLPGGVGLDDQYAQALNDGNALFSEGDTQTPLTITGHNLDPSTSYSLWVNSQRVSFTILGGLATPIGVRPTLKSVQLQLDAPLRPGTHLIELRPSLNDIPTPSAIYSLFSPLDNQIHGAPPYVMAPLTLSPTPQTNSLTQTFRVRRPRYVTGVQLRFRALSNAKLTLLLRDEGSRLLLAEGLMGAPFISQDGTGVTRFNFGGPIFLQPDRLYGLVLVLMEGEAQVYTAKLGGEDLITKQTNYLGAQTYNGGHLYLPGYVEAFDEDLTYTLDLCEFFPEPQVVQLGEYGINDLFVPITAIAINTRDICPLGTRVVYEYSYPMGPGWKEITPNQYTPLPSPVDKVELRAILFTSTKLLSPILMVGGASVSLYSHQNYAQVRSIDIEVPLQKTLMVIVKWEGVGNVSVKYNHSNGVSGDIPRVSSMNGPLISEGFSINLPPGKVTYTVELVSDRNLASPPIIRSLSHELTS